MDNSLVGLPDVKMFDTSMYSYFKTREFYPFNCFNDYLLNAIFQTLYRDNHFQVIKNPLLFVYNMQ